ARLNCKHCGKPVIDVCWVTLPGYSEKDVPSYLGSCLYSPWLERKFHSIGSLY
ncbi:hypothetical protein E2320_019165, partial [Naja naja]